MMSYAYPKINKLRGIFRGKYVVDEAKYRKLKEEALKDTTFVEKKINFQKQRDLLLQYAFDNENLNYAKFAEFLITLGFGDDLSLKRTRLYEICIKKGDVV